MVNIVLIGATGVIARRRHLAALTQSSSANLYGFYARTAQKVQALAQEYQVKAFNSLEEIWQDEKVDAVLICTPTPSHCELAIAALQAGKHVLCEKAMATSTEEARRMAAAVKASGKKLMMLHVQRRYAPHIEAKRLLDSGEIGRLLSYRTFLGIMGASGVTGPNIPEWKSVVADIGSHRIDLMRYMAGAEVKRAFGHTACLCPERNGAQPDNAVALLEHENGVMGVLCFGRSSYNGNDRSTVLFGTEGAITLYGETHELVLEKKGGVKVAYTFPKANAHGGLELTDLHQTFCECIEQGKEMPINERDGVACMCIIDAINQSVQQGAWAEVAPIE